MYIDSHVHLRDFNQKHKETIKHGLEVARDSGLDAVFDMPNTDPPTMTREIVLDRLRIAKEADIPEVFYGLYMGLTANPEQIKEAVRVFREFPQVIGMKLYAGHSVGNLGVITEEAQRIVYETLAVEGYEGVLEVHCEEESLLKPYIWNPKVPITHCFARPECSEIASVGNQLRISKEAGYKGKLDIAHISSPKAVDLVIEAQAQGTDVSCEIAPHHYYFDYTSMIGKDGIQMKMNPPLRSEESRRKIFQYMDDGKISRIGTDHAPHDLKEKTGKVLDKDGNPIYMSGIIALPHWPLNVEYLRFNGFTENQIGKLTFYNTAERFGLDIKRSKRKLKDRRADYPFDPYQRMAEELNWKG